MSPIARFGDHTGIPTELITGQAGGVPFVAAPPVNGARASAPVVVAWHLMDPPRTEAAFAAALPLDGLDAWRIYLGLPMSGSRLPPGGAEEFMRLGYEDAVLNIYGPVSYRAAEEFGAAFAELRQRLQLDPGPIGVMGGSQGAAVAQLIVAEGELDISAAVLVSPVVQLRQVVAANERRFGVTYQWSDESNAVADRLDFVARATEISHRQVQPATLLVVGEQDAPEIRDAAAKLQTALRHIYAAEERVELATIPDMEHALADEPGTDPAPQTPHAAVVDRLAAQWFQRYLSDGR